MHIQVRDFTYLSQRRSLQKGVKGSESMAKAWRVEGSKENVVLIEKEERKVVQAKQNREQ